MIKKMRISTLSLVCIACIPSPLFAHAALVKSVPGSRAVIDKMPPQVELCFNEEVDLKFSTFSISDTAGKHAPLGPIKLGRDARCLSAKSGALAKGTYQLNYHVLSKDGHIVKYGLQFTIRADSK
ncbi:hypothetical protein C1T17_20605 (plasmid) [Sphingobium sp. SCG-1]|uniref:copper resistance CopC family protein n=1 Tax=Sphingobium sp. SCG-1 TaxID=2072936 RepID=UPI000CD6B523|nr:copper resistance CopC family protein [Sphingobium sp. SCG-1]AUW60611.1 hypothetical protein C1T17_20605 [Sphingobium sp. SCG-1]